MGEHGVRANILNPDAVFQELKARGHDVSRMRAFGMSGCATTVMIDPKTGSRIAGAGPIPMREARYSPDGLWLVFENWPSSGNHEIAVMTTNGTLRRTSLSSRQAMTRFLAGSVRQ